MLSTQKSFNLNSLDKRFPCDKLRLARLSYANIFQDSRTWLTLLYAD